MPKPLLKEFTDNNDLVSKIAEMEARLNKVVDQDALLYMQDLYEKIKRDAEHYLRIDMMDPQHVQGPVIFDQSLRTAGPLYADGFIGQRVGSTYEPLINRRDHYVFTDYPRFTGHDMEHDTPEDDQFVTWFWAKHGKDHAALVDETNYFGANQVILEGYEIRKQGKWIDGRFEFTIPETFRDPLRQEIAYSDYVTKFDLDVATDGRLNQVMKVVDNVDAVSVVDRPVARSMILQRDFLDGFISYSNMEANTPGAPYLLTTTADISPGGAPSFRIGTEKIEEVDDKYRYTPGFSNPFAYIGEEIWTKGIHIAPSYTKPISESVKLITTYTPEIGKPVYPTLDLHASFAMYPTGKALNTSTKELDEFDTSFLVATDSMFWITPSKTFQIRGGNNSEVGILKVAAVNNVYSVNHYATEIFYEPVRISPPPASTERVYFDVGTASTTGYTPYFQVTSDTIVTRNKILGYLSGNPVFALTSETTGAMLHLNGAIAINRQTEEGSLFSVSYTTDNTNTPVVHNLLGVDHNGTVVYDSLAVSSQAGTALAAVTSDWTFTKVPLVAQGGATIMAREVDDSAYHPILQVSSETSTGDADLLLAVTHNKGLNRSLIITKGEVQLQDYQGTPMLLTQLVNSNWEFWVYNKIVYNYDSPAGTLVADKEIAAKWYVKQQIQESIPTTGTWQLNALLYLMHAEQDSDPATDVNAPRKAATHGYVHGYVDDYVDDALLPYSKTDDMHGYVTGALGPYAKTSWVLTELQDFPTFTELDSRLMSYPTFAQLQSYLSSYAQITYVDNRLSLYVLKSELTSTLGGYATIGYVNSQLGGYSTKNYVDQSTQQTLTESKSYSDQGFLGAVRDAVIEGIEYFNGNVGKGKVETSQGEETGWFGDVIKFVGEAVSAVQNFFSWFGSNEEPPLPIELEPRLYATHAYTRAQVEDYLQFYTQTEEGDERWALKEEIPSLEGYATQAYVTSALQPYATKNYVTSALQPYASKTYVDATIERYVPQSGEWKITSLAYGMEPEQDDDTPGDLDPMLKFATHGYVQSQINALKQQITTEIKKWIIQQILEGE